MVVGGFQVWLLFRTWRTITRQANLQEFTTRQWVDIEGWSIIGDDPRKYPSWGSSTDEPIKKDEELRDSMEIQVYFEVANNTPLPLSIKRVVSTVSKDRKEEIWEESAIPGSTILLPQKGTGDNIYACYVPVTLAEREVEFYATCGLGFWINVVVYFLNAQQVEIPQLVAREVACNERGFTFTQSSGKHPSKKRKHSE